MATDESHFNVSLIARDNVTRQCPQTRRAEADSNRGPSAYQPNALPLGQTGSHRYTDSPVGKMNVAVFYRTVWCVAAVDCCWSHISSCCLQKRAFLQYMFGRLVVIKFIQKEHSFVIDVFVITRTTFSSVLISVFLLWDHQIWKYGNPWVHLVWQWSFYLCIYLFIYFCVRACVRACVRVCVRACVRACVLSKRCGWMRGIYSGDFSFVLFWKMCL